MPSLNSIIGLPGIELENASGNEKIEVWAYVSFRPPCIHCESPQVRIKSSFNRKLNHTRQGKPPHGASHPLAQVPMYALWEIF